MATQRYHLHSQDSLFLALSHPPVVSTAKLPINGVGSDEQRPLLDSEDYHPGSSPSSGYGTPKESEGDDRAAVALVPKDRYYLAQGIFFLIGVGMLFPWNVFITATSFFELKFFGSPFYDNFERLVPIPPLYPPLPELMGGLLGHKRESHSGKLWHSWEK